MTTTHTDNGLNFTTTHVCHEGAVRRVWRGVAKGLHPVGYSWEALYTGPEGDLTVLLSVHPTESDAREGVVDILGSEAA